MVFGNRHLKYLVLGPFRNFDPKVRRKGSKISLLPGLGEGLANQAKIDEPWSKLFETESSIHE